MVIYISKIDKGIITKGMKFVHLSDMGDWINTWCVEMEFHFKISKTSIKRDFEIHDVRF